MRLTVNETESQSRLNRSFSGLVCSAPSLVRASIPPVTPLRTIVIMLPLQFHPKGGIRCGTLLRRVLWRAAPARRRTTPDHCARSTTRLIIHTPCPLFALTLMWVFCSSPSSLFAYSPSV